MGKKIRILCGNCESKLTPESAQYNKFKGKKVRVEQAGQFVLEGILDWVDLYTLGVQVGKREPTIVYKGPGMTVALTEDSPEKV